MDGQAAPGTYHLLKRFSMPHGNGTMDAIAVSHSSGLILVSLYTLMIKAAITQFWGLIVLVGVAIYLKRHPLDDEAEATKEHATATAGLWNARGSPERVVWVMSERLYHMRRTPWYPLLWIVLAALAVGAALSVPIVKTKQIKIGTVAPVNASAIYVPPNNAGLTELEVARSYSLGVPGALRAAGATDAVPPYTVFVEKVDLPTDDNGQTYLQINYRYGVTAADFGLQRTPGLALNVSGSCVTDYAWLNVSDSGSNSVTGIDTDVYFLWGNPKAVQKTSNIDGGPPFPFFWLQHPNQLNDTNTTYAIIISSIDRYSYTKGTDPWYLTQPSSRGSPIPFFVQSGRPALSCWETGIWSYKGSNSGVWELNTVPGLKLSDPLINIFKASLGSPMIYNLGIKLGRSALASAASAVGPSVDANSSSIQNDLQRLVNASYIATRNLLAETTRYSPIGRDGLQNLVANGSQVLPDTDEFVVSNSADIITLSVRVLIIVPAVLGGAVLLVFVLANLPPPWRSTRELNAVAIHKHQAFVKKASVPVDK
jgi:hypothetical protein